MARSHSILFTYVSTCKFVTLFIVMSTMATFAFYGSENIQPKNLHVTAHRHCAWMKAKTYESRNVETPPWFALLSDYKATIRFGKNLYLWPDRGSKLRLGNRLFNYAAAFGIAWRNRRIPIWPKNRGSENYDITKFFNLRIPEDKYNTIINVCWTS